jgi:SpoU rRNA methylase family enzyme
MLNNEIKKTFISLTQKEDLIHAFDIKHLISEQDFNDIVNKDLKETIQKKIEQYIQTGEINFFDKMINVFNLKESNYINEQNKKLAIKGIGCCLENKNLEKLKQIKEKFKIQNTEIIENTELQKKIINLLKGYLNEGDFNEFKKTCDNLGFKKEDIVNDDSLRRAALQGIDKDLKTSYNTSQAVLIKEFFNFSINTLNDNLDTYIQDPEKEAEKTQKFNEKKEKEMKKKNLFFKK